MKRILFGFGAALASAALALAADPAASSIGKLLDQEIRMAESEVVPLAEAMPADKYDFAPTQGEFKGTRTFSQQMTHIAAANYMVASAALAEPNPCVAAGGRYRPPAIP